MSGKIIYPYIPEGQVIRYVPITDIHMMLAKEFAEFHSLDELIPGAAIIIREDTLSREDMLLGIGANGSDYHKKQKCQRVILGCKTGERYELCEGCHPKNHSEVKAVNDAKSQGLEMNGASLYLWGHWWFCKYCWDTMLAAGITNFYLLENSEVLFNKEHPNNIIGRQFEL